MKVKTLSILAIYILCSCFFASFQTHASRNVQIVSPRSLRQQVDAQAELLEKEVRKVRNKKDKFRTINRVVLQIKNLGAIAPSQDAEEKIYLKHLLSVLESLPAKKNFKVRDCAKYKKSLLDRFDPMAVDKPQDAAVKTAWQVLGSLCS